MHLPCPTHDLPSQQLWEWGPAVRVSQTLQVKGIPLTQRTMLSLPSRIQVTVSTGCEKPHLQSHLCSQCELANTSSALFSCSVMSDSLGPHGLQHARPACPSPTPGAYSDSCPSNRWCHPTISSSVVPFSSCPQSFPASGSFPVNRFFTSGGQSIGVSASASVLPMNIQDWFPLGRTSWISLQSKGYQVVNKYFLSEQKTDCNSFLKDIAFSTKFLLSHPLKAPPKYHTKFKERIHPVTDDRWTFFKALVTYFLS